MQDHLAFLPTREPITPHALVLRQFALPIAPELIAGIARVAQDAPFRHLTTPGGRAMSVAMTNCGPLGWVSDHAGYRYQPADPATARLWPPMPAIFQTIAARAALDAGFPDFQPDACLINRYQPGTRLTLHQDRDERDMTRPIVSVSLGLPAVFLFGGLRRGDRPRRIRLEHGDVVVWGNAARLAFHGVEPLAEGFHPLTGGYRLNLTFRKAG